MARGSHSGGLRSVLSIMAGLGMAAALAAPAEAQGVNIGTLTCSVASGWGLILGSARALGCNFTAYGGRAERYVGTIWKLGLDIGYTQNGVMVWTVFAPAFNLAPGALAGTYAGGTASVTVGLGVGANGLVGGSFNSITLQPLSIETNQGLSVAAGVASLTLEPAPELAGPAR
jgi:Protein of unknown function (DUF992)